MHTISPIEVNLLLAQEFSTQCVSRLTNANSQNEMWDEPLLRYQLKPIMEKAEELKTLIYEYREKYGDALEDYYKPKSSNSKWPGQLFGELPTHISQAQEDSGLEEGEGRYTPSNR